MEACVFTFSITNLNIHQLKQNINVIIGPKYVMNRRQIRITSKNHQSLDVKQKVGE